MPVPRSLDVYGAFVLPHLFPRSRVVDVGCGSGELSIDLAGRVGSLLGIDMDPMDVARAQERAFRLGVVNARFEVGDAYALELPDDTADLVFAHSVLEALERPNDALREAHRILKPGGVIAAASVEYGGLILAGPDVTLLRRFYEIREEVWRATGSDPQLGRQLRALLHAAQFAEVDSSSMYVSYGTDERVRSFGLGRAAESTDEAYVSQVRDLGLSTPDEMNALRRAWLNWSESPDAYAAFAWCQALGTKR